MSGRRDLIIETAFAVTLAPPGDGDGDRGHGQVMADVDLVVSGGRIEALRPRGAGLRSSSTILDRRRHVLLPGLINAHLHSEFLLLKGLVEDRPLDAWEEAEHYNRAWAWVRDPANLAHVRNAYRASYAECLRGGTTFVAEFNCADSAIAASVEAMTEIGIRGVPTVDLGRRAAFADIEERGCLHAIDDERGLTEAELGRARALLAAGDAGARLTMHAAETAARVGLLKDRLGMTTVQALDAFGLLGPHLLLSHAIHVTPAEVDRIAATGTHVVASPVAEMKLGDGIGPVAALLERGVPVCLGTDAAVCNNGSDMFQEMKTAALLQKVTHGAQAVTAAQALAMATAHGALATGQGERAGRLQPGMRADLVLVDARSLRMAPLIHNHRHSNVIANLVYCATAADVTDVLVGGEPRVCDRRLLRTDEVRLLDDLQASADALYRAIA